MYIKHWLQHYDFFNILSLKKMCRLWGIYISVCLYVHVLVCSVTHLCPTLCDSIDCSSPGSSLPGIFQVRILEWVAVSYSGGFSWLRDWTLISWSPALADILFTSCTTWETLICLHTYTHMSLYTHTHTHTHILEKEMATHSSVLAWRIPGMGEPGGRPSVGLHRVRHDCSDSAAAYIHIYIPAEAAYSTSAPSALHLTQI